MEMLIIGLVAIVAFAAVLIPLFRRGTTSSRDGEEFSAGEAAGTPTPDSVLSADPETGDGVVPPLASGPATPVAPTASAADDPAVAAAAGEDELELEIQRYRAALRAGTICNKCGQANPADSAFCFECGAQLPLSEAREFE